MVFLFHKTVLKNKFHLNFVCLNLPKFELNLMKFIHALFVFLTCGLLYAQTEKNIDQQSLLWTRYYNLLTLNDKWAIHTEFDNRVFINPLEENLFLVRMHGRYKINNNVDLGAGTSYFSVATQVPGNSKDFCTPEYRAQQDISWKQ